MPTIAHISDLHLQSGVPERQTQVEPILQKINEMKPDLVVISGDVTDDGWDSIDELKWAKDWLDVRIKPKWISVPGNHDVGNFLTLPEGQVNADRVRRWREVFGDTETKDLKSWVVFGINSMLFGTVPVKDEIPDIFNSSSDLTWAVLDKKHIAVFLHSPLFVQSIEEKNPAIEYWVGPLNARQYTINLLNSHSVKFIGSGHVHQSRLTEVDGVKIAWAPPASGTWVHAPGLPNPPMPEKTGFFLHHLHDDGRVESELVECAPMLKCIEFNPWP